MFGLGEGLAEGGDGGELEDLAAEGGAVTWKAIWMVLMVCCAVRQLLSCIQVSRVRGGEGGVVNGWFGGGDARFFETLLAFGRSTFSAFGHASLATYVSSFLFFFCSCGVWVPIHSACLHIVVLIELL